MVNKMDKWIERVSEEELYLAMHYINSRYAEGLLSNYNQRYGLVGV